MKILKLVRWLTHLKGEGVIQKCHPVVIQVWGESKTGKKVVIELTFSLLHDIVKVFFAEFKLSFTKLYHLKPKFTHFNATIYHISFHPIN